MAGGGFPLQLVQAELLAMGFAPVRPPRSDASKIDALQNLWTVRGSTALKRGKSRCNERLPISKTFGRQPCWDRRLVRQLPLWWLVIGTSSKRECVHVCRQTVRGASPTGKCGKGSRTWIGTTEGGSRRFSTCIAHAFGLLQFSQAPLLLADEAQYCFGAGSTSGGTRRKPASVPLANTE